MNSVLTRNGIEAGFTLLAWRSLVIAAEPGLIVHVRGGMLRVREGAGGAPQVLEAGGRFVARRGGLMRLQAPTHAELHLEWPDAGAGRLSPGLEPVAMEPIARAARP